MSLAGATIAGFVLSAGIIDDVRVKWGVFVLVFGAGLMAAYISGRQRTLPLLVCDELSTELRYVCRPCSPGNLQEASRIVQRIFGRNHIDYNLLEQWRLRNPKGFMEIVNEKDVLVGCFVVIGVAQSFMDEFKRGTVSEALITSDVVLPIAEAKRLKDVYISGVMVRDPGGYLGSKRARVLIWSMLKYLKHHYGIPSKRSLYAVALTKEAEKLLKSLNFSICSPASGRVDRHNLYKIDCTKEHWEDVSRQTGDLSLMCSISY